MWLKRKLVLVFVIRWSEHVLALKGWRWQHQAWWWGAAAAFLPAQVRPYNRMMLHRRFVFSCVSQRAFLLLVNELETSRYWWVIAIARNSARLCSRNTILTVAGGKCLFCYSCFG